MYYCILNYIYIRREAFICNFCNCPTKKKISKPQFISKSLSSKPKHCAQTALYYYVDRYYNCRYMYRVLTGIGIVIVLYFLFDETTDDRRKLFVYHNVPAIFVRLNFTRYGPKLLFRTRFVQRFII
uniref:Uncharacterized protein n=1 Tax=Schizaphis graminum TaxID=13262 RepID=A0A2S2PC89_SCHGA